MPGSSPTETELQTVCMLQSSIGKMQGEDIESNVPAKRLHNALSSTRAFESLYLELTGTAITTYKNIGRARAANVLGMDLAHFYS
ncbi:PREDICTED: trafficking protein particle complex subunit 10-like [Acropora digitifera]|uniref:trafficking protein particle complex subunit 10-like n=1 Tax=Acropora digitifera TaxID=70779 RepID=UPI00077A000F|nr:PREDICTED: trafficking protein particle complex subunit 10-like [Acropora digitifera]